jgi:hypothetical protein
MRFALLMAIPLFVSACRPLSPEEQTKRRYERYHAELVAYSHTEKYRLSSDLGGYRGIPSYDAIVALGPPAVPSIAETLRANKDPVAILDILADAIIEIKKWNREEFHGETRGRSRLEVLERLDATQ